MDTEQTTHPFATLPPDHPAAVEHQRVQQQLTEVTQQLETVRGNLRQRVEQQQTFASSFVEELISYIDEHGHCRAGTREFLDNVLPERGAGWVITDLINDEWNAKNTKEVTVSFTVQIHSNTEDHITYDEVSSFVEEVLACTVETVHSVHIEGV